MLLLDLPHDTLVVLLGYLDTASLSAIARTSHALYFGLPPSHPAPSSSSSPTSPCAEVLFQRAILFSEASSAPQASPPPPLPPWASSWVGFLLWRDSLRAQHALPLAAGEAHSLFVDGKAQLLSCGREDGSLQPQLGHGPRRQGRKREINTPILIGSTAGVRFRAVVAGNNHSFAISENGELFSWGRGTEGQLGHGDNVDRMVPTRVRALRGLRISSVAAGALHSLALTDDGSVYSWGCGDDWCLGHPMAEPRDLWKPRRVEALRETPARCVAAGAAASFVVSRDGLVYAFGAAVRAFGLAEGADAAPPLLGMPQVIPELAGERVAAVAARDAHYLALTATGAVYSWGDIRDGKLGHGSLGAPKPRLIESLRGRAVRAVSVGPHHSCAVTEKGELFTWGRGALGALGHGDAAAQLTPKRVESLTHVCVLGVSAGHNHTLAFDAEGAVHAWGAHSGFPGGKAALGLGLRKPSRSSPVPGGDEGQQHKRNPGLSEQHAKGQSAGKTAAAAPLEQDSVLPQRIPPLRSARSLEIVDETEGSEPAPAALQRTQSLPALLHGSPRRSRRIPVVPTRAPVAPLAPSAEPSGQPAQPPTPGSPAAAGAPTAATAKAATPEAMSPPTMTPTASRLPSIARTSTVGDRRASALRAPAAAFPTQAAREAARPPPILVGDGTPAAARRARSAPASPRPQSDYEPRESATSPDSAPPSRNIFSTPAPRRHMPSTPPAQRRTQVFRRISPWHARWRSSASSPGSTAAAASSIEPRFSCMKGYDSNRSEMSPVCVLDFDLPSARSEASSAFSFMGGYNAPSMRSEAGAPAPCDELSSRSEADGMYSAPTHQALASLSACGRAARELQLDGASKPSSEASAQFSFLEGYDAASARSECLASAALDEPTGRMERASATPHGAGDARASSASSVAWLWDQLRRGFHLSSDGTEPPMPPKAADAPVALRPNPFLPVSRPSEPAPSARQSFGSDLSSLADYDDAQLAVPLSQRSSACAEAFCLAELDDPSARSSCVFDELEEESASLVDAPDDEPAAVPQRAHPLGHRPKSTGSERQVAWAHTPFTSYLDVIDEAVDPFPTGASQDRFSAAPVANSKHYTGML